MLHHEWLQEKLETFHKVLAPRVKVLEAGADDTGPEG